MTVPTAGIDGCRAGWVTVTRAGATVTPTLTLRRDVTTAIDMPIGLPAADPRQCDREARAYLRHRASTVFPTPPRGCLGAPDHATATAIARAVSGRGISVQAFHLLPKIAEVDAQIDRTWEPSLFEAHPECAFARLNGDQPLPPKRTEAGRSIRRELLAPLLDVPPLPRGAAEDDLLDACVLLLVAEQVVAGTHRTFGDGRRDERGLLMRIVS